MDPALLHRTAEIAAAYLGSVADRPVGAEASLEELRRGLGVQLGDAPLPASQVIEELVAAASPGLVATQSPRYFGFVIGGGLDAAIAADWLTTVWDQNGGGYPCGPSAVRRSSTGSITRVPVRRGCSRRAATGGDRASR